MDDEAARCARKMVDTSAIGAETSRLCRALHMYRPLCNSIGNPSSAVSTDGGIGVPWLRR